MLVYVDVRVVPVVVDDVCGNAARLEAWLVRTVGVREELERRRVLVRKRRVVIIQAVALAASALLDDAVEEWRRGVVLLSAVRSLRK
jgi:hypothetical protein